MTDLNVDSLIPEKCRDANGQGCGELKLKIEEDVALGVDPSTYSLHWADKLCSGWSEENGCGHAGIGMMQCVGELAVEIFNNRRHGEQ